MCSIHKGEMLFCQVCKFEKATKSFGVKVDVQKEAPRFREYARQLMC